MMEEITFPANRDFSLELGVRRAACEIFLHDRAYSPDSRSSSQGTYGAAALPCDARRGMQFARAHPRRCGNDRR
jgi:hypothetical protein